MNMATKELIGKNNGKTGFIASSKGEWDVLTAITVDESLDSFTVVDGDLHAHWNRHTYSQSEINEILWG